MLPDLALVTWHSGGLRAVDLRDPTHPTGAGFFLPTPNAYSVTPDPALEPGSNNVIAWSYPIIRNGLIYYIDIRNGLYIVRYDGPHADQVGDVRFLEGNSNLGDAYRLEYGQRDSHARVVAESLGGGSGASQVPSTAAVALPLTGGPGAGATASAAALAGAALGAIAVRRRRRRRSA